MKKGPVDYKATLNLPKTDFAMKADLARKEPEMLARWEKERLYDRILAARKGAPPYVLHDGPPYANGHIHYGHILNKILKDIVCKSRTMAGHYVEYKPGWDTHGLPIELAVLRDLGERAHGLSAVEIRRACHEYALRWVDTQRDEFKRLGVFGTWDAPYLTLDARYEATIVRELASFAEKNLLHRAKKPVHWCMSDKTALAEAEIEYDEAHTSPSIYVKFALPEPGLFAVIWTTTPWTLPANLAIAYHPSFKYTVVRARGESYVVAAGLADAFVKSSSLTEDGPREPFPVERFTQLKAARHPFIDRASVLLPAEHVTLEAGTGLVHTAPGHGADDYALGQKHGLSAYAPVDDGGVFTEGPWKGEHVWKANPKIVAHLHASGALVSPPDAKVTHAYPICWRCKNPIIFRATWQWFAKMDAGPEQKVDLRKVALAEIERTAFIPPWGKNRIGGMIANRPDWVLSRQRVWGVPIPVLYESDDDAAEPIASAAFMRKVADLFEREGADAWFGRSAEELGRLAGLQPEAARRCRKGNDIVDVWFESGVSGAAVCEGRPGLMSGDPARGPYIDLYLEGSDQHRGWFHSALLTGVATHGHAPYKAVLTHGFVLDDQGRPYSKSEIEKARREGRKVDYIEPKEVLATQGAELFRMWAASADFRSDVAYSRAHLQQLGESYRKVRNTLRFLLGNLYDFTPDRHAQAPIVDPLDRHLYERIRAVDAQASSAYEQFELHVVVRALLDLCALDLSALYLDVRKDRLYCDPADSPERRATQAVLYQALRVITTQMAPILCFTAEETFGMTPRRADDPDSVHLARLGAAPLVLSGAAIPIEPYLQLRAAVQKALEPFRAQKKSSLDAHAILSIPAADTEAVGRVSTTWLADLFIVSRVTTRPGPELVARIEDAGGHKCERCWKWTDDQPLCARCQRAIAQAS
jgi:isoleucyl-tRNA synthetase